MIVEVAVGVRTNMRVEQEGFAILDQTIGVAQIGLAFADALDLGPAQGHSRLVAVEQKVVVTGSPVVGSVAGAGSDRVAWLGFGRELGAVWVE